ncbi:hypothetical protein [Tengunoibacter tsumagoiensis]|uniref:Xylose isomerase-like TIM barrel domain-containing protein n=1 Tax=Tengunoibacter tsumagoiensis TaxID=2014871 RepID=A0A402A8B7_9CHLR|nr:hypothetical protein [Tengunoibacter tsumagoiensis]GCE15349.1 hypothetical protein KTT_52080 [Tengunoibacter tsumagoiensis]
MPEVRNTHDKTNHPPYVRFDIAAGNVFDLPEYSSGPKGDSEAVYTAIREAGFQGIQDGDPALCARVGLHVTGAGRVDHPQEAATVAERLKTEGYELATLHVGRGMESEQECIRLAEAIVEASVRFDIPLYIETHRATITQDLWRTVQLARAVPGVRFNGDFSHWYTGLEMVYGDIEAKFAFLEPVFERTRFIHGRIGSPGSIQVGILPDLTLPAIAHFQEMWTRSFVGFLRTAQPGDFISFTPELLRSDIYYARTIRTADGALVEESDRWQEALAYLKLARGCFEEAQKRLEQA